MLCPAQQEILRNRVLKKSHMVMFENLWASGLPGGLSFDSQSCEMESRGTVTKRIT